MTCDKHKKEPARGYSECVVWEIKRLNAELSRLRAVNAELVEALNRIANTCDGFDECPVGPQTIAEIDRAALSRAELFKLEPATCVWKWRGWQSACCGMIQDSGFPPETCPSCGGKVEAWDVDGKRIEQAGKAEGRQG